MEAGQQQAPLTVDVCVCITLIVTLHIEDFEFCEVADVSCTFVVDRVEA